MPYYTCYFLSFVRDSITIETFVIMFFDTVSNDVKKMDLPEIWIDYRGDGYQKLSNDG